MYNDIIIDNFTNPQKVGDIALANCEFEIGNPVCGDRIKIQLMVENNTISEARFRAWGCATSIATANLFCESIEGKTTSDINQKNDQDIFMMFWEHFKNVD